MSKTQTNLDLFRQLPSVDEVLRLPKVMELAADYGSAAVTDASRVVLSRIREEISGGRLDAQTLTLAINTITIAEGIERELRSQFRLSLRHVINATGVVLHTNLGRAPLSREAIDHVVKTAGTYSNL
jgi:L-seryl-tRNA(Ser) seleniumtransferase